MSDDNTRSAVNAIYSKINQLKLNNAKPILVVIDGRSGTGKSTIAKTLAERSNGVIVVSDDFYSGGNDDRWEGLTPQEKVDQVIDWEKLRYEVLEPLKSGKPASWHPLDFRPGVSWIGWKKETVHLYPAKIIILDGSYSSRPELSDLIDLSVLVETSDHERRQRLIKREGSEFMEKWHKIWDPAEDYYFSHIKIKDTFDLVVKTN